MEASHEASPAQVYQGRIDGARVEIARLDRQDSALALGRALAFVAILVAGGLALHRHAGWSRALLPAAIFGVLVFIHDRVLRRREHLQLSLSLCEDGLARIADQWAGKGDPGASFQAAAEGHLYAADLDLFGVGGLYELLSVARTPIGRDTLAAWLQAPASATDVRARQGAVAELAPLVDLRHDLMKVAARVNAEVREEALRSWAVRAPAGLERLGAWRAALLASGVATVVTAALGAEGVLGLWPCLMSFAVGLALSYRLRAPVAHIVRDLEHRADELRVLAALMLRVERESFQSPALRALRAALETGGLPASRRIAQLKRLVDLVEGRRNLVAGILMGTVQAAPQLALAIEAWRRAAGPAVLRWLAAVGELEALSSLATFRFERPEYPFPTLVEPAPSAAPLLDGEALGHPLIPAARRVVNDLSIGGDRRLILVSGSNMSGKSTLLRAVGVNAVLALAGAPVCAQRLTLSPLTLGATLRVNDSLQAGRSRFYAELARLKQIVERSHAAPPLLFLLDEILHGTNSHDRRIGAEAIIRGLVERGAAGLVTTHDLALAEVTESLGARAVNVHFEDHLEGGVMSFDYKMKPGVVRKSNALELMRAMGLQV